MHSSFPRRSGPATLAGAWTTAVGAWAALCTASAAEPPAQPAAAAIAPADAKFFEEKVRPLFVQHCHQCHAGDKDKGGLRLDSRTGLLAGGDSGPAVVPGKPAESLLVEAVKYESFEMPPAGKLSPEVVAVFEEWIRRGAPFPGDAAPAAHAAKKKRGAISDEDRKFWSFQPLAHPVPPTVQDGGWSRNEIDRFLFAKLQSEGLKPAPEADKRALARRAYFDLHGLPPSPEELQTFLADASPDAFERLVDRLLASPRYGERWARHWLDLVRYAESDGFREDAFRPTAWRYRDYVVRALNADKPYDRFVAEQLAGDELAPDDPEAVVATGFLRQGMYEYNQRDVRTQWSDILNEATDVTADVFLGMGMSCARCHDHKFDPILQKDYFRLQAFLAPMRPRDDVALFTPADRAAYDRQLAAWMEKTAKVREGIDAIERPVVEKAAADAVDKFPEDIQVMLKKPAAERTPLEQQLAELAYRQVALEFQEQRFEKRLKGDVKERWLALKKELAAFDAVKPPPPPTTQTVVDVSFTPPPTVIPGDRKNETIPPGFLTILDPEPAEIAASGAGNTTGRRSTLARWLTRPDHPLTTRVIVNRVWQYHFGKGLAAASSDFGRLGEAPTHPELLDWLATDFTSHGWSLKRLHRQIVLSSAYRQTAFPQDDAAARLKDPENRLRWKTSTRRLDAEQIRDAVLAVTGELDLTSGGPSVDAGAPRRSVYTKVIRNTRDPFLDVFDAPDGIGSTPERLATTTPNQALLLMNGKWLLARAAAFAQRLQILGKNDGDRIRWAYRIAYGREAKPEEFSRATEFLARGGKAPAASAAQKPAVPEWKLSKRPQSENVAVEFRRDGSTPPLRIAPTDKLPAGDFTVEAVVHLRSLFEDAKVNTIVAQWDSNNEHRGWSLGVTSEKSKFQPRNLIMQIVGRTEGKEVSYEVTPSNLRLELNRTYQVAAVVRLSEQQGRSEVLFFLRELGQEKWQTAVVPTAIVGDFRNDKLPLTFGGRVGSQSHGWDGWLDDLRIHARALEEDAFFAAYPEDDLPAQEDVVGLWRFDDAKNPGADALGSRLAWIPSPRETDGKPAAAPPSAALVDLCHALLISNEFLYVD